MMLNVTWREKCNDSIFLENAGKRLGGLLGCMLRIVGGGSCVTNCTNRGSLEGLVFF